MLEIKNLNDLRKYAERKGLEIHVQKDITDIDYNDVLMGRKKLDECVPCGANYGIKVGKEVYLWFKVYIRYNEEFDIDNGEHLIDFDYFYNANSGVKQKGSTRYFNWCYKQEAL